MAISPEALRSGGGESLKPEKRALLYHGPIGGILGAVLFGVPGAMLGYLAAGSVSWYQGRLGKRRSP